MTPKVSDFIPCSLEDTDEYIEGTDGNYVIARKKRQVQIKVYDNNRDPFIATLKKILLAPDICNRLFIFIKLMN